MAVRTVLLSIIAALGLSLGAPPTSGATGENAPADFRLDFQSTRPGAPSDAELYILYKDPEDPGNPEGQSPPLTEVRIAAPPGTIFDGGALPACTASNEELMLLGQAACPEGSRVGGGSASVVTTVGPPSEQVAEVTLFNYGDGVIELLEFSDGGLKVVDRAEFEGANTMVLHPAVVPGFTEREFSFSYDGLPAAATRPFITTPPKCPPSGVWRSRLTYTVTTGATYSVRSPQRCRRPRIRASVSPRRVRAGSVTELRVRLRSSEPACIAGATVRVARRRVRTDQRGRATIRKRFRRPGRRLLIASKRGCARGRATIAVLPER